MADFEVPDDACDCHMHVFGDPAQYPPAALRAYTPTPMGLAEYQVEQAKLGFSRVVIVQPSAYGTDNRCTLDALRTAPAATRAVVVIDEATPDSDLAAWAAAGVRGIRLNLVSTAQPDPDAAARALRRAAERCAPLGWHIQLFAQPRLLTALADDLRRLPVPLVIDHMGATDGRLAAAPVVLGLLQAGRAWVKLSGANRVSVAGAPFADALPVMRALLAANPARCVWGTDWPHIGPHRPGPPEPVRYMGHDHAALLALLGRAAADAGVVRAVLADNPAALYGF